MKTWDNPHESPSGQPYPKSAWDRFGRGPFRWATPAYDPWEERFPEPWRVTDKDEALSLLKKMFPEYRDLYTDFWSDQVKGRNTIWVGLQDNRNKLEHEGRLEDLYADISQRGLPVARKKGYLLLVDDIEKNVLTRNAALITKLASIWQRRQS